MRAYFNTLNFLTDTLQADDNVNTVTSCNADEVSQYKQNIYPLANVLIETAPFSGLENNAIARFNVEITALSIRDKIDNVALDKIYYNDNRQENWNLTYQIIKRLIDKMMRQENVIDGNCIEVIGASDATRISGEFGQVLDGWTITLQLEIEEKDSQPCS